MQPRQRYVKTLRGRICSQRQIEDGSDAAPSGGGIGQGAGSREQGREQGRWRDAMRWMQKTKRRPRERLD